MLYDKNDPSFKDLTEKELFEVEMRAVELGADCAICTIYHNTNHDYYSVLFYGYRGDGSRGYVGKLGFRRNQKRVDEKVGCLGPTIFIICLSIWLLIVN
jgi:hypothetical protein